MLVRVSRIRLEWRQAKVSGDGMERINVGYAKDAERNVDNQ